MQKKNVDIKEKLINLGQFVLREIKVRMRKILFVNFDL